MCLLGLQKLKDLESFSNMFLNYDLLAQREVRYAYVYPFAETLAGVLMVAGAMIWLAAPLALFIGTVGAFSVFKSTTAPMANIVSPMVRSHTSVCISDCWMISASVHTSSRAR
jgi:uncharacterized membrane protein YphA (DoxX/SURF4 family)